MTDTETNVMTFEKLKHTHLEFVKEVRNQATEFLHDPTKFTIDEVKQWYNQYKNGHPWYLIWYFKVPIGYIRCSEVDGRTYIGMDLHEKFRGQGLSQRAYREFIPWIYIITQKDELWLKVLKTNIRAIYIYEKLGFQYVESEYIKRNNQKEISLIYKHSRNDAEKLLY